MQQPRYSEADTRAKLIDPALRKCGWTEEFIRREETPGAIRPGPNGAAQRGAKKADYVLRLPPLVPGGALLPVALIEAKKNTESPSRGMEQAKEYGRRFQVPFVYSSNGYMFVEYDAVTGQTAKPRQIAHFPTPADLRQRYEAHLSFGLEDTVASALVAPYAQGDSDVRYYQDAAIRATLRQLAAQQHRGEPQRALLNLATGAGKTRIAVALLQRLEKGKQMKRALFLCDRDLLRQQAHSALSEMFGNDAGIAKRAPSGDNEAQNARVHIATYQTLGVEGDGDDDSVDATFAAKHYPPGHFSHIIIDECHRSLRGDWTKILHDNPNAAHIGLTATVKQARGAGREFDEDHEISSANLSYFGHPVYVYPLSQGTTDGYLALCQMSGRIVDIDQSPMTGDEVRKYNPVNRKTGESVGEDRLRSIYNKENYDDLLMMPDRIAAMCKDLFEQLCLHGSPEEKTIIFCASGDHARAVSQTLNSLHANWRAARGDKPLDSYAFVCMAGEGDEHVKPFQSEDDCFFAACTVDLLATGVDIPAVRNIVIFTYVKSPIRLRQMIGRGARLHPPSGKLSFDVYDYTNSAALLDLDEYVPAPPTRQRADEERQRAGRAPDEFISIDGLQVNVQEGGSYVIAHDAKTGNDVKMNAEQYRQRLTRAVLDSVTSLDELREVWTDERRRPEFLQAMIDQGYSPAVLQALQNMGDYDDYDIIADSVFGAQPLTRQERADAFARKNEQWLASLREEAAGVLLAFAQQFALHGTEELGNRLVFQSDAVRAAGGLQALQSDENPVALVRETKRRLFVA